MTHSIRTLALTLAIGCVPVLASAQDSAGGPPSNVRVRIGPLFVNPTLSLSNAGKDTNVFNDATAPKEDFTVTITPATDLWFRIGPSWLTANIREDMVWFNRYASERSANNSYNVKWLVSLNRLTLSPAWIYTNSRERPSYEIDARAEHTEAQYAMTAEYRLLSKTFVGAEVRQQKTDFAEGGVFLGADLHDELSRTSRSTAVNVRNQLTPLTSVSVSASLSQDIFAVDPLRNSDARTISTSIRFDPAALLKGSATFGFKDFKPSSPDVPSYKGSTFGIGLTYVLLGMSRFQFNATRDTQYSFDVNQPYYVLTALGGSVSQQIFGPVDVVARGSLERLEYRDRAGAAIAFVNRVDHAKSYGGGVGYHLGRDMRVGFNVDHQDRESAVAIRSYQGWTYGMAITYATGAGS